MSATTPKTGRSLLQLIEEAWCDVLGRAEIDRNAGFFDLGGDSLGAARVAARVAASTGRQLTLEHFFAAETVVDLVSIVEGLSPTVAGTELNAAFSDSFAVLPGQESYLRRDEWSGRTGIVDNSLVIGLPLELRGPLDLPALQIAIEQLGQRHSALRSRFSASSDQYRTHISDEGIPLRVVDCESLTAARTAYDTLLDRHFDRFRDPLAEMVLYRLTPEHHVLAIKIDHLIADGWSASLVLTDLAAFYNHAMGGPEVPANTSLTYPQYLAKELDWNASDRAAESKAYWINTLQHVGFDPSIDLDYAPRGKGPPSARADTVTLDVPARIYSPSGALAGFTPFMIFCTAVAIVLGRHSGRRWVGLITAAANRSANDVAQVIGWLSNSVVVQVEIDQDRSLRHHLEDARTGLIGAVDHSRFNRHILIKELAPELFGRVRDYAGIYVSAQSRSGELPGWQGLEIVLKDWNADFSRHGISCTLHPAEEASASIRLESNWLTADQISSLAADLRAVLEAIADDPDGNPPTIP